MCTVSELKKRLSVIDNLHIGDLDPCLERIADEVIQNFSDENALRAEVTDQSGRRARLVFPKALRIQTKENTLFVFSQDIRVGK